MSNLPRFLSVLCLVVAALMLSACGNSNRPPELPALAKDAKILIITDSMSDGTGIQPEQHYTQLLAKKLERTVIHENYPQDASAKALENLPALLKTYQPQLVILAYGIKESQTQETQSALIDNLRLALVKLQQNNIAAVLIGMPLLGQEHMPPPKFYRYIGRAFEIPYHGAIVSEVLSTPDMHINATHPSAAGHQRLANGIAELLHVSKAVNLPEFDD